ncbi:MAG: hypothetical protein P4M04_16260 [Acidobacteriota bacterium]|nr:hypothetical protein [Acidobacteriota bacterium]
MVVIENDARPESVLPEQLPLNTRRIDLPTNEGTTGSINRAFVATLGDVLHPRIVEFLTRNQIYILVKDYPRPVRLRLLPRILVYQSLWMTYAIRNRAFGAYLRGWGGALRGMGKMRRKHRELMAKRRIGDEEFLDRLRESERQVHDWQQSRPPGMRSGLLNMYFRVFGRP